MYYRNKRKGIQETIHVVNICIAVCGVCSSDLHTGEDWHRGCKLKSGNCHQNSGRCRDGMGYGVLTNAQGGIAQIGRKSWIFLILSGLATGASWLCYYRALQLGEVSKVVPIDKLSVVITLVLGFVLLHEQVSLKSLIGCILIGAGTLVMAL